MTENELTNVLNKLDELASTMTAEDQAVLADILNDDDTAGYTGAWPGTKQPIGNTRLKQLTPPDPYTPTDHAKVMGGEASGSGI